MRILHVIPQLWRGNGAAKIVRDLVKCQITQGYFVKVAALYALPPTYDKELEDLGCEVVCFELRKYLRYQPKYFFRLREIIKEFDIVHVHLFPALYWVALAKWGSGARCKLVFTEHATLNNRQGKWWLKPVERFIYRRYDVVVAITDAVKEKLHRFVDDRLRVVTIFNGIDLDCYRKAEACPRKELGIPEEVILLTQVARFSPQKNQLTVIRALARLPEDFHVMFVGDGSGLEAHKREVERMGLLERIHFLGLRQDVPALLKVSDIVVLSTHFEGFGLAAVEGMAAGKPVIGSDVDGLLEVIQGAGIVFPVQDDKILAEEILRLSEDRNYMEEVSRNCLMRAKEYDIWIMGEKYDKMYKRLIKDNEKEN